MMGSKATSEPADEAEDKPEKQAKDPVAEAYNDVLGRDPTDAERQTWGDDASVDTISRHLAATDEAAELGVDAASYGVAAITEDELSEKEREYYDIWRKYNPDEPLTNVVKESLGWFKAAYNPMAYEARQRGLIVDQVRENDDGSTVMVTVVTPDAALWAGGAEFLKLTGVQEGWVVQAPTGTRLKYFQQGGASEDGSIAIHGATGTPKDALLGDFGEDLADLVPNELKLALDPLGLSADMIVDRNWSRDGAEGLANVTGLKDSELLMVQDVGRSVVQGALMGTGVGAGFAVAMEFAARANDAIANNTSMADAMENAAWNSAAMVLTSALSPGVGSSGIMKTAGTAAAVAASQGLTIGLRTGDWDAAGDAAMWGAAGSLVGSAAGAGIGSAAGKWLSPALTRVAGGALGGAATLELRYALDKDFADLVDAAPGGLSGYREQLMAQGAAQGAMSHLVSGGGAPSWQESFGIEGSQWKPSAIGSFINVAERSLFGSTAPKDK